MSPGDQDRILAMLADRALYPARVVENGSRQVWACDECRGRGPSRTGVRHRTASDGRPCPLAGWGGERHR